MRPIATFVLCLILACEGVGRVPQNSNYEREFHSVVPLGAERIDLRPAQRSLYVLATAESPVFEGWHAHDDGEHHSLLTGDGTPARFFPLHLDFRLTATAMRPDMLMIDSYGTLNLAPDQINDYLLKLRFQMLVFHGLQVTHLQPQTVSMIGMPADVQYDERIWQISFDLPNQVPIEDHIVLEVLSPSGVRLCKFHLEFF